jgi:dienelactone hydrolase
MSLFRRTCRFAAWTALLLTVVAAVALARLSRDLEPEFHARRGLVAGSEVSPARVDGDSILQLVSVRSTSGLVVDLAIRRPRDAEGAALVARPLAVLLGGYETGRDAIDFLSETRGVAVAALSFSYRGPKRPKDLEFLREIPAIQEAMRDTPPAILLALDWLRKQAWVDPERVELVGASLGVPFVCIAGALDPGVSRVWALHGAASPRELLEHSMAKRIGWAPLRGCVAWIAARLAYGESLDPARWVARIAPRSFVMVNASGDERIPGELVRRLYESANEPKELIWQPGGHVQPGRREVVRALLETVLDRMTEAQDA